MINSTYDSYRQFSGIIQANVSETIKLQLIKKTESRLLKNLKNINDFSSNEINPVFA